MGSRSTSPTKLAFIVPLMLVLLLALAACGGGGSGDDDDSDESANRMPESGAVAPSDAGSNSTGGEAEGGDAGAQESNDDDSGAPIYEAEYIANQVPLDRLVIRTVTISLTVEDVSQGSIWLRDLAARKSGFVFSSNTYVRDESEFAQITLRIPADQLDSTVQELREHDLVVQVDSEESTSQDVSQEFVDNEARLEALEETQRRFLALLSEADSVEEILRIEAELTNIRSQIETIKGRQNYLSQMTSFSTVTITLHAEDTGIESLEDDDEGFIARVFGDSWDSASGVIEGLLGATITIGIIGLALLPLALLVYFVGRFAYRRVVEYRTTPEPQVGPVTVSEDLA